MAKKTHTKRTKESSFSMNVTSLKLDVSGLKALKKKLETLPTIEVGFLGGKRHPTWDFTYAELAALHHFGIPGETQEWFIPPRRIIPETFERLDLTKFMKTAVEKAVKPNGDHRKYFNDLGKMLAKQMSITIEFANSFQANAPMTVDAKGKDDPLNWTGALAKAPRHRVVIRGKKK